MQTSRNKKISRACGLFIALLVLVNVPAAWSSNACCLTTYMNDSVFVNAMITAGYTNVQKQKATCDEIVVSGTLAGVMTMTYDYKMINANDMELTMTQSMGTTVVNTIKDTSANICSGVINGLFQKNHAAKILSASPNPFHSSIQLGFENPSHKAGVAVYAMHGVKVADVKNVQGNRFTWVPAGIENGMYLIVITTGNNIVTRQVTYLKK